MPRHILLASLALLFAVQASAETVQGRLEWAQRVDLATTVSGVISKVSARAGQKIKKGGVLVQLDRREYAARVRAQDAKVARAQPAFEEAERELERAQELYDRTVLSDHDLQQANILFASAQADLNEAKALRTEARVQLERASIRAPFDAIVLGVNAIPGQVVINQYKAETLATVADGHRMAVRLAVSSDQIGSLSVGQDVKVTVGNESFDGQIAEVGLEPSTQGGYSVQVEFDFGDANLRAGSAASVDLP